LAFLAGRFRAGEPTLCRNVHDQDDNCKSPSPARGALLFL